MKKIIVIILLLITVSVTACSDEVNVDVKFDKDFMSDSRIKINEVKYNDNNVDVKFTWTNLDVAPHNFDGSGIAIYAMQDDKELENNLEKGLFYYDKVEYYQHKEYSVRYKNVDKDKIFNLIIAGLEDSKYIISIDFSNSNYNIEEEKYKE